MADETPPPAAPGAPERRRPAPTIDLEATEIATGTAAAGPGPAPPPEPSPLEQPEPSALEQDAAANMPPKSAVHRALSGLAAAVSWPLVGAGLAGAILVSGVWVVASGQRNDASLADARIAQLERQVADLASRVPADPANSLSGSDLASRLQRLEAQLAQVAAAPVPDPASASRIAAVETQLKTLGATVGALGQRGESTAAANASALAELNQKLARTRAAETQSSDTSNATANANAASIASLADRLDALEGSARTTETTLAAELAKRSAEIADDHAVRTAVVAAALTAAVERGRPFVAELKAAQAQASDASALAPLEGFATAGVPNVNALVRELSGLEPALLQAAGAVPSEAGFLEKLQANAERLVRIRPIEEVAGDDPAAVISRIQFKAVHNDLPGALAEFGKLPAPVRAPAQAWIAKAQARAGALAASRAFAADALVALAQPSR